MNHRSTLPILAALALLLSPSFASAANCDGVQVANSVVTPSGSLALNGCGLRSFLFLKIYVIGLYLQTPDRDAASIVKSDQPRRVDMHMLRKLEGSKIAESVDDGFQKNVPEQMGALRERLDRFKALFPVVDKGQIVTLSYTPGKGTSASLNGKQLGVVQGKDFADALFAVWLGKDPVTEDLRDAMLGPPPK